ncbi:SprB repeat-containing protein [Labilibaculum sp. K2S]|uniref:SprB repeat-containing protein n=1 Tax=Labilibaculum sp. K2S TaxID=3056386 RepID=UPI0025A382F8|nr:SprB repeat-containing protein [Labilibaculum sp. K2S]MDM8161520.1 SprB repeat-containing protein [Labilibaculum sp. K2S]
MKLRFLLFFILVFLLGSFSVKAQGLKYNGEVEIKIFVSRLQAKLVNENKDGTPDNKLRINKKYGTGDYFESKYVTGTCSDNPPDWEDWTGLNMGLPISIHSSKYNLSDTTLKSYFGINNNKVSFEFEIWEWQGKTTLHSGKKRYYRSIELDIWDIIKNDPSPGWHKISPKIGDGANWAVDLEYSITPPSVKINNFPEIPETLENPGKPEGDTSFEEGSIVPLKVDKLSDSNVEYEWMVQIDNATTTEKTNREVLGPFFFYEYGESFPWISAIGREPEDGYNLQFYSNMSREEIWNVTQYVMFYLKDDPSDTELEDMIERNLIDETIYIPYFVPAIDSKTKSNITKEATCDYLLPESNKFYRNFKFRVQTIVRTDDKDDLRCIEEDKVIIVDVFPHYPEIQPISEADKKTVTCSGGDDGELKVRVDGDLGTNGGVVAYRATVWKTDDTYSDSKTFETSEFTFYNLSEGDYELTVSNGFNQSNTENYEDKDSTEYNGFFLLGHETVPFTIKENEIIKLSSFGFESTGNCDEFQIINPSTSGGVVSSAYTYSLTSNGEYRTELPIVSIADKQPEEEKEFTLWVMDDLACYQRGKSSLIKDSKLEFAVPEPIGKVCFGELVSHTVSGVGGSGEYHFSMDGEINPLEDYAEDKTFTDIDAKKHTFKIKDSHGCTAADVERTFEQYGPIEIYEFERTEKIAGNEIHISCNGASDGEVKFKIKGGTPKYSYILTGPTPKSGTEISENTVVVIQGLLSGEYTLTILDKNGCSLGEVKTFKLEEPSIVEVYDLNINNYDGYTYRCNGSAGEINFKVKGGIAPYTISNEKSTWSNVPKEELKTFSVQGAKSTFEITDELNCTVNSLVDLKEPTPLKLIVALDTFKSGDKTEVYNIKKHGGVGNIALTIEGGIRPYVVQLIRSGEIVEEDSPLSGSYTFTDKKAGDYVVRVEGKFGGCKTEKSVTLTEPDPLVAAVKLPTKLNTFDIKCHGDDARVLVTPSGGIKPYVITITGNGKTLSKTVNGTIETDFNLKAGSYTLSIKGEHNPLMEIEKFTLTEPETLGVNVVSSLNFEGGYQIKCFEERGEIKVTPSGGVSDYKLIQNNGVSILERENIDEPQTFSTLDAGSYLYTITDANGCEETAEIELKKPNPLVLHDPVFKIPSCHHDMIDDINNEKEDGEIQVDATGGCDIKKYIYSIYNHKDKSNIDLPGKTIDFTGLKTGMYDIKVTDVNGCYAEKIDQKLEEPKLLFLDKVNSIAPECHNDSNGSWTSKIIGGTGGTFKYSIDGAAGIETGRAFNQSAKKAGSYEVSISDENKCVYKQNIVVPIKDSIVNSMTIAGIDVLEGGKEIKFRCFGETVQPFLIVNGGNPLYSVEIQKYGSFYHSFSNVANNTKINFPDTKKLSKGTYSVLTTDTLGCQSASVKFTLDQPTQLKVGKTDSKYSNSKNEFFDYTCFGVSDILGISVNGGTTPYTIEHDGVIEHLDAEGNYVDFDIKGVPQIFLVKDSNGCENNYTPDLLEPLKLELELSKNTYKSDDYNIKCFAGTDSIWAKATGGITPYTFELLDKSNTPMASKESNDEVFFEDLPAGLYHVKVTGAYNTSCSASDTISLKQPDPINANINLSYHKGFEIKCKGLTDTIKVEALGGISPYTIHLKGMVPEEELTEIGDEQIEEEFTEVKNGQVIFSDLPAGKYQVSITDQFKACEYVKDTVLTEPTVLKFDIETSHYEGGFEIRCSYLKDSVKITPYGGLPITNASKYKIVQSDEDNNHQLGNIIAGENLVFRNLEAGMYSYIVSDDNGCSVSNVATLVKPDSLQITGVDFTIPTCHAKDMGDISKRTDGEIKVQATGGVSYYGGYYDFLLNKIPLSNAKDRLDSIRGITNATFIQRETGEYIVEVTDANACIIVRSKQQLNQADWLHIENFNSVIPECYEAKDGFWESEVLGGTSTSGSYSFIISKDEQDFRNGTTGKEWNQDQLGKGKYLLEITDDLGCYYKQEEELLQPAEMAIDFDVMGVTDFGNNDGAVQARVSGGNGDYRYQWYHKGEKYSNGTLKKIEELYAGEYTVEVWDKNNCPYGNNEFGVANGLKKTAGVMEPGGKLTIVANPVKTSYYGAEDGVLEVSAVGGWPYAVWPGYEFSLNQGVWLVTSKFENLKAGLYQLRVKDSKGVKDSIELVIEEPDEILMELEKSNCLCFNDESGSVRVSATGGTEPYTYAINYAIDFSKSNEFTNLKAGNYRVFVKDKLGNIQNQYINVDEPENLKVELSDLTHSTCNSGNGSAKIEITGGTPEYYINWGDFYPANKLQPNTLAAGNYKIEVTDANSCVALQSFSIGEKSGPEISLMDLKEVSCHESTDGEISIEITNGTEPYDVIWKGLESLNPREIRQLGKGKYSLVVSDANNCFAEAEYEITGPEELELYVSSLQSPNCVGIDDGSILLTAVGGSPDYIYNLNGKSNINGWFPNLGAGGLQIEVTDTNACKKTLEAELSAPVPVTIELPYEYVLCRNQTETVNSGVDGASNKWFFGGNQFSVNNEVELTEEGNYRLVVTTEKGCEAEHEFAIAFLDYEVVADFIIPVEAIVGDTIVAVDISWEQPDSVKWHFPDGLEVVKKEEASIWLRILEAGNHTIGMSIFKNECNDYMEKQVVVAGSSTKRKAGFIQPDQVYITEAKLYPNPNRGDFHLKLLLSKTADVSLEIYDVERALKIDTHEGHNNAVYQFDFNNRSIFRPNNVYAVVIIVGKERRVLRFLVY